MFTDYSILMANIVIEKLAGGFSRKLVTRISGATIGTVDVYVISPDGTRFR